MRKEELTMAKKVAKAKSSKKRKNVSYGIDDMVNAVHADIMANPEAPASAKELTKKAVKAVLQSEHSLIAGAVSGNDKVAYIGFGTFEQRDRQARKGRNPQTGEEIEIPATTVPAFKPGKAFKDAVKGE
jgi:DNA-binding protein HU-beta